MQEEEMVLISKAEYESLQEDSLRLSFLEAHGVDNWCGYGEAMFDFESIFEEKLKELIK